MKILFTALMLFANFSQADDRVYGGTVVTADSLIASSTVSLNAFGSFFCSGTIIADDMVLTAAHCMGMSSGMTIKFGVNSSDKKAAVRKVINTKRHQDYKGSNEFGTNDIALVHFEGGIPQGFKAAQLPGSANDPLPTTVIAAGFGLNKAPTRGSGVLNMAELDVKGVDHTYKEIYLDQTHNKGACFGDSGGPLYEPEMSSPLTVIGVVSRGEQTCVGTGIFEMVQEHLDWIATTAVELRK